MMRARTWTRALRALAVAGACLAAPGMAFPADDATRPRAGSLVTPGTEIPDGMLAMGAPCKVKGPLAGTAAERWVQMNPAGYQALAQRHRKGVQPA